MSRRRYSASDLAALGYCEIKVVLDATEGEKTTPSQEQARERGKIEHARFHQEVMRERAGPCFIATVACGSDHPTTVALRRFRDRRLRRTAIGRCLVGIYYRSSPPIARWLARHPVIARIVGATLDAVAKSLKEDSA